MVYNKKRAYVICQTHRPDFVLTCSNRNRCLFPVRLPLSSYHVPPSRQKKHNLRWYARLETMPAVAIAYIYTAISYDIEHFFLTPRKNWSLGVAIENRSSPCVHPFIINHPRAQFNQPPPPSAIVQAGRHFSATIPAPPPPPDVPLPLFLSCTNVASTPLHLPFFAKTVPCHPGS